MITPERNHLGDDIIKAPECLKAGGIVELNKLSRSDDKDVSG
jgi:hypothetical protein